MILSAPAMILTAAVTWLAVLVAFWTGIRVARTRRRVKIAPPAVSGHPDLECALRVQGNTLEQFAIFLPILWLAALYFQGWLPPLVGVVWCLGRIVYAMGYRAENPGGRQAGFALTILPTAVLAILAAIGIVNAWLVTA